VFGPISNVSVWLSRPTPKLQLQPTLLDVSKPGVKGAPVHNGEQIIAGVDRGINQRGVAITLTSCCGVRSSDFACAVYQRAAGAHHEKQTERDQRPPFGSRST
jgi:hypothetical protein